MTPEARKYRILEQIVAIQEDQVLIRLEAFIESARKEGTSIEKNALDQLIDDTCTEEPIENLIAMTTHMNHE